MPFKSEAQRRKFYAMADRGEMPRSKVEEYERATKGDIPERVKEKREERELKKAAKRKARGKLNRMKNAGE